MPMVPEAVIAMLACARIGAVHSVVFGGFAAHELATRINDAGPKLMVSASCGIEANRVVSYKPLLDAAIELSTGGMEEVLASHPDVAECAVMGVADEIKGEIPLGTVVLKAGLQRPHQEIVQALIKLVRERIGPVASFRLVTVVKRLPKTRSGKVLRGTMKRIADGVEYRMPATIDDPAILDEIAEAFLILGYPKRSGSQSPMPAERTSGRAAA